MVTYVVSNANELHTALDGATSGDRIELAHGNYGDFFLKNTSFTSDVTITAQSANAPPVFDSINLWNVNHLAFNGIKIEFEPDIDTVETDSAFKASVSSHITLRNSDISGGTAINGIDPSGEPGTQGHTGINGYPIGRGLNFQKTTNIIVENNDIQSFTTGALFSSVDDVVLSENSISGVRKTSVNGDDVSNILVDSNFFTEINPWKYGGLGDHADYIHFWTSPTQDGPSENLEFSNNFFTQGSGQATMGIYLDDDTNNIGFRDVSINNNVMHNNNAQGVQLEDVVGGEIYNNTFLQSEDNGDPRDAPGFRLADGTRDLVIRDNIVPGITGPVGEAMTENNIQTSGNVFVQRQDAKQDTYQGHLFVNGLADNPSLNDLRTIPGSLADGHGAQVSNFVSIPGVFDGFVNSESGEGLGLNTVHFSVMDGLLGVDSQALQGATFNWYFGDGTSANGQSFSHTYGTPGLYDVAVTVTTQSGETYIVERVVQVETPYPAQANFNAGLAPSEAIDIVGQVSTENSDLGTSVRVGDNSSVQFNNSAGITNNAEFSISFAFKKDLGAEADGGRVLYFSGTSVVNVSKDSLILRGKTDQGEDIKLQAFGMPITDTNWHQITYTFSQADGTAILYLDGQEVSRLDGLQGAQHTTLGHDLHLGNPFGSGFDGLLDSLVFVRESLNPEQVQEAYQALSGGQWAVTTEENQVAPSMTPKSIEDTDGGNQEGPAIPVPTLSDIFQSLDQIELDGMGVEARVDRAELGNILGADAFEITFSLAQNSKNAWGEVARLQGSFIIEIEKDGQLRLRVFSDEGELVRLTSVEEVFDNYSSRDVTVSLEDGILTLALEGGSVVTAPLNGNLGNTGYHDLVFGNPWGHQNFDGEITNFSITETAVQDASEILSNLGDPLFSMQDMIAEFGHQTSAGSVDPTISDAHVIEDDGMLVMGEETDKQRDSDGMISQANDGMFETQPSIDRLEQDDSIPTLPVFDG